MKRAAPGPFGAQLKALREAAGFTQDELATIAGLSIHAVSALERGERRRPHVETVRALSAALDLTGATRDGFQGSARAPVVDEAGGATLPLPPTILLGRDADMQSLRGWLADPVARLITLTGPGGVGKTRLALELAHAVSGEGAMSVVFVSLAAIREPSFVASAIAEALGLTDVGALDLPRRARVACANRSQLMVLDNFEQVLPAAPLITDLLSAVPSLRLMVTSRASLHVRGEREYVVGPLELKAGSEQMSLADLARVPAVRLFVERIHDVQPDFHLTHSNGPTVATICRRLDALPLALELAAPWIKVLTVQGLLSRLESDGLVGVIGARDLPERHQTMNATVAWSYQLLDAEQQRAFRRLSVVPGPFSIDAAEAVIDARRADGDVDKSAVRMVSALIDKSLLLRSETSAGATYRYMMLDTVRAYALLELTAAGERDDALEALARFCVAEASRAAEGLVGPAQVHWLDRVRENLDTYRVVLQWLVGRSRPTEAAQIASSLMWFWAIRGHVIEGLQWFEQISNQPSLTPSAESRLLSSAAAMRYLQGDLVRARGDLVRALDLADASGETDAALEAEWILGFVEHAIGNLQAARDWLAKSVQGFQAQGIPLGVGQALTGLAWVALAESDAGEAERLLDEATGVLRGAGPWFLCGVAYLRALLAVQRANADEAIVLIRESLTRIRELKDQFAFVYAMIPLAAAAVLKGDDRWAARIVGARDAVIDSTGLTYVENSVPDVLKMLERDAPARLGAEQWAQAYAAGYTASIDSLLKDIELHATNEHSTSTRLIGESFHTLTSRDREILNDRQFGYAILTTPARRHQN